MTGGSEAVLPTSGRVPPFVVAAAAIATGGKPDLLDVLATHAEPDGQPRSRAPGAARPCGSRSFQTPDDRCKRHLHAPQPVDGTRERHPQMFRPANGTRERHPQMFRPAAGSQPLDRAAPDARSEGGARDVPDTPQQHLRQRHRPRNSDRARPDQRDSASGAMTTPQRRIPAASERR